MLSTCGCLRLVGLVGTVVVLGGCPYPEVGFHSSAPSKRLDAIALASQEDDHESLVQLVEKLGSTDPAERMLAIRALEKREGTTLGYDHAAAVWERLEVIELWKERIGLPDPDAEANESPMENQADHTGG